MNYHYCRLRAWSSPSLLTLDITCSSRVPRPPLLLTGYKFWTFQYPLRFDNLFRMTPGTQESDILMITVLLKGQRIEPPKGRETQGEVWQGFRLEVSISSGNSVLKLFIGDLIYRYCIYRGVELWPQDWTQIFSPPSLLVRRLGGQANIT